MDTSLSSQGSTQLCPQCQSIVLPNENFCPKCGFQLVHTGSAQNLQILSVGKQIWIYFVSIVLPPLGLIWTFKYLRSNSPQLRRIAFIAAGLTVISIIITLWISVGLFNSVNQQVQTQLNGYQNLGI